MAIPFLPIRPTAVLILICDVGEKTGKVASGSKLNLQIDASYCPGLKVSLKK
jgi:hypothetical protein